MGRATIALQPKACGLALQPLTWGVRRQLLQPKAQRLVTTQTQLQVVVCLHREPSYRSVYVHRKPSYRLMFVTSLTQLQVDECKLAISTV